jgi:predicted DNA-binding transcriptional regulator AlpA
MPAHRLAAPEPMQPAPDLGLVTAEQAAPMLHLSTERFREQVRRPTTVPKPLPQPIKVGRRLLWRRADLEAWTAEVFGGRR